MNQAATPKRMNPTQKEVRAALTYWRTAFLTAMPQTAATRIFDTRRSEPLPAPRKPRHGPTNQPQVPTNETADGDGSHARDWADHGQLKVDSVKMRHSQWQMRHRCAT